MQTLGPTSIVNLMLLASLTTFDLLIAVAMPAFMQASFPPQNAPHFLSYSCPSSCLARPLNPTRPKGSFIVWALSLFATGKVESMVGA